MHVFLNAYTGCDPEVLQMVVDRMVDYNEQDDGVSTTITITLWNDERQKWWKKTYLLPFQPVGLVVTTTGSTHTGRYYLARGENGKLTKKLVSGHPHPSPGTLPKSVQGGDVEKEKAGRQAGQRRVQSRR